MGALLVVAGGGAIGASLRYGVSLLMRAETGTFPWHTFGVNVAGSFLLGLLVALLPSDAAAERWRLFLGVGVLGGFTTFSTMSMETVALTQGGAGGMAAGYAIGSMAAGLVAAAFGHVIGRAL